LAAKERALNDLLILVRSLHFAATVMVVGVTFFLAFVAEPAFRTAGKNGGVAAVVRSRLAWIAATSLLIVVISGATWLVLLAQQMSDLSLAAVFSEGTVWTVLTQTGFGQVWVARFFLAGLLAGTLFLQNSTWRTNSPLMGTLAVLLGVSLVGTLAWAGHAAASSDSDIEGIVHLTADILHLVAAAAWVGSLVPLAVLLGVAWRNRDAPSVAIAREATLRFSTLGILSVGTLLATGVVNSWVLAGSVHALVGTDYGRLLLVKVALFLVMLSIAAVNRFWLTPRLVQQVDTAGSQDALRRLRNNSLIEATVGAVILAIVGVLGTLPPGLDEEAAWQFAIPLNTAHRPVHTKGAHCRLWPIASL
jgi:putative copper resistance protein D